MKFSVGFKTPDAVYDAIENEPEDIRDECRAVADKFVEYGEYITVEFDTISGTATVIEK